LSPRGQGEGIATTGNCGKKKKSGEEEKRKKFGGILPKFKICMGDPPGKVGQLKGLGESPTKFPKE